MRPGGHADTAVISTVAGRAVGGKAGAEGAGVGMTVRIQYGSAFSCTHFQPVKDITRGSDLPVLRSRFHRRASSEAHVLLRALAQRAVTAGVLSPGL